MTTICFNKPFRVLCQFSASEKKETLTNYIDHPDLYPAGRLDFDSEGLLLLTDCGTLQNKISSPTYKWPKSYLVQVEGEVTPEALEQLRQGVTLKDGKTLPAKVHITSEPDWLWPRQPPVRFRAQIPTSWIELEIRQGKNRQVRRMTAGVGFPTLRLIRTQIGPVTLDSIPSGKWQSFNERELFEYSRSLVKERPHPHKPSLKKKQRSPIHVRR